MKSRSSTTPSTCSTVFSLVLRALARTIIAYLGPMTSEVIVGPRRRHKLRGRVEAAMRGRVSDTHDATEVGSAQPTFLVIVISVQLPAFLLKQACKIKLGVQRWAVFKTLGKSPSEAIYTCIYYSKLRIHTKGLMVTIVQDIKTKRLVQDILGAVLHQFWS